MLLNVSSVYSSICVCAESENRDRSWGDSRLPCVNVELTESKWIVKSTKWRLGSNWFYLLKTRRVNFSYCRLRSTFNKLLQRTRAHKYSDPTHWTESNWAVTQQSSALSGGAVRTHSDSSASHAGGHRFPEATTCCRLKVLAYCARRQAFIEVSVSKRLWSHWPASTSCTHAFPYWISWSLLHVIFYSPKCCSKPVWLTDFPL